MNHDKSFFLSAYTCDGKTSFSDDIFTPFSDDRLFLVKGASGKARSEFIKTTADIIQKEGFEYETILSDIDGEKIEGVIFDEIGVYILDACVAKGNGLRLYDCTQYIVNLGEICCRKELYEKREEIFSVWAEKEKYEQRCRKFLNACVSMQEDTQRIVGKSLNAEKLEKYVTRFVKKEFGAVSEKPGKLSRRFVGTLSPDGINTQYDTIKNLCAHIFVLDDSFNIVCETLLNQIKDAAISCGYDVTVCCDFIDASKIRHLIIPQLSLCFFTSDYICKWEGEYTKKLNFTRFVDRETVKCHKNRIKFNADAIEELVCQASVNLEMVKCDVDRLDDIYENYCDNGKLTEIVEKTADEILSVFKA